MWIANLVILLIVLGCTAYQYLKSTLLKAFAATIITICASIIAFAYFELLAGVFISRAGVSRFPALVPWAQPLSFALLFIVVFAILQTIAGQLTRTKVDFGILPERIGRVVCGIFLGLIAAGLLLTALAMAPLPNAYPYQRFDAHRPDPEKPSKALFSPDGFVTGWFNIVSKGSLSGKRSFATLHANFLDQAFLNRHSASNGISVLTTSEAIELPRKRRKEDTPGAWRAPEALKDSKGSPIRPKSGHSLTIVRVGIKKSALKEAGKFTTSQLRLICKQKPHVKNLLGGRGIAVYPLGYLNAPNRLQMKGLDDTIEVQRSDFEKKATVRWMDFAFYVPNDCLPVLLEFKQNGIIEVPPLGAADQAPPPVPFGEPPDSKKGAESNSTNRENKTD
jgi:hypothetical protein